MNRSIRTAAVVAAVGIPASLASVAQAQVLANAVPTIALQRGPGAGSTAMGVAHHPGFNRYYASNGGNPAFAAWAYDAAGNRVQDLAALGIDARGWSFNPATSRLQVNTFNSATNGLQSAGLDGSGNLTGVATNILPTMAGAAGSQSMMAYDAARNIFYSRSGTSTVNRLDGATGALAGTVVLNYAAAGVTDTDIAQYHIGYDPVSDWLIVANKTADKAVVFDAVTGAFVGASQLNIDVTNDFGAGFANGQFFVWNAAANSWQGFNLGAASCQINVSAALGGASTGWPKVSGVQTTRLFRDGVPDTCALSAPGGTPLAGNFAYDRYTFLNTSNSAVCVTVDFNTACTGTNFIYAGAYVGGYNPANPTTNNVASIGSSPNPTAGMSFNVPANSSFDIVVAEVTAGAGCPNYSFTVGGLTGQPCQTAACPPAQITGAIGGPSNGWPSAHGAQNTRLFRDGVPDTCAAPGTAGTPLAGTFGYDRYDFVNLTSSPVCVTVDFNTACTGTNFIYAGAYIGGYNPATPVVNNVASIGGSPNPTAQMSFIVPPATPFQIVVSEVTAGAGCPNYTMSLSNNFCGGPAPCYANCDGSTVAPILNVNDFICFQTRYAANDPYANCDGSTVAPILNVNDFICFQTRYAQGCP